MKRRIVPAAMVALLLVAAWRGCRQFVPAGATSTAWLIARVDGPPVPGPDGSPRLTVYFNDAGAAHSGYFWTWIVIDRTLTGKCVVAQGYSDDEVRYGREPFPMRWIDRRTFAVRFLPPRRLHDGTTQPETVVRID